MPTSIQEQLDVIDNAVLAIHDIIESPIPPPPPPPDEPPVDPPPPPPMPEPPSVSYLLTIPAESMRLDGGLIEYDKPGHTGAGSIGYWGKAGESVAFSIDVLTADDVADELAFRYGNGTPTDSRRTVEVSDGHTVVASKEIAFPHTADWGLPEAWSYDVKWDLVLPKGRYDVTMRCLHADEYLDLDEARLMSSQLILDATTAPPTVPPGDTVPPVPIPPPGPVVAPVPPAGATIWNIPQQGSWQSVLERARPGDFVYVSDIVATNGYGYQGVNRDMGDGMWLTIIGNPGHVLRSELSGFEGFGSMRGWRMYGLNFEVSGGNMYNSGVSFYGMRTDHGADGAGCARIELHGVRIRPIVNTGRVQRDMITLWGGDLFVVAYVDVAGGSFNDLNGCFGCAGSGISIGDTIKSSQPALPHPSIDNLRVWVHHAIVRDQHGPGSASADRNGINLDGYQNRGDCLRGATLIEDSDIADCDGRGILAAFAGFDDSPILIRRNKVRPPMAQLLGGSLPGGIVAYGGNTHSNIELIDNDVEVSDGQAAYRFEAVGDVHGYGNKGQPIVGAVPEGFSAP